MSVCSKQEHISDICMEEKNSETPKHYFLKLFQLNSLVH